MTPFAAVPLNSWTWLIGTLACVVLAYRSFASYRRSANELSKYLAWFAAVMACGQGLFAVPSLLTLTPGVLRTTYVLGEGFVYASMIAQAAIVWCLVLRSRLGREAVTLPVALIGTLSWLYAVPHATLRVSDRFITYRDPLISTLVIGVLLLALFLPVGVYFLRAVAQQKGLKSRLTSIVLGLVYIGIGVLTGGMELATGQVMTRGSAIADFVFFGVLLVVFLWPHRQPAGRAA